MIKKYHIRDLEEITGIKVATIRMWEKRYNLLTPIRSESNIRYYDEQTFKKFSLIVTLYRNGFKISDLARLSIDELKEKNLVLNKTNDNFEAWENELMQAVVNFDFHLFRETLNDCVFTFDLTKTATFLLLPFVKKIDIMWKAEALSEFHYKFLIDQSKRFFYNLICNFEKYILQNGKSFLILNDGKDKISELYLLYANSVVRKHGFVSLYFDNLDYNTDFFDEIERFKIKTIIMMSPQNPKKIDFIKKNVLEKHDFTLIMLDPDYHLNYEHKNLILVNTLEDLDDEITFSV